MRSSCESKRNCPSNSGNYFPYLHKHWNWPPTRFRAWQAKSIREFMNCDRITHFAITSKSLRNSSKSLAGSLTFYPPTGTKGRSQPASTASNPPNSPPESMPNFKNCWTRNSSFPTWHSSAALKSSWEDGDYHGVPSTEIWSFSLSTTSTMPVGSRSFCAESWTSANPPSWWPVSIQRTWK